MLWVWRPRRLTAGTAKPFGWLHASMLPLTAPHKEKYQDDAGCNPKNNLHCLIV